jgi:hypothetical protein
MVPIANELKSESFVFLVMNGQVPAVFVEGCKMSVVSCQYEWNTADDKGPGESTVTVSGYFRSLPPTLTKYDDQTLRTIKYNFVTKEWIELQKALQKETRTEKALKSLMEKMSEGNKET